MKILKYQKWIPEVMLGFGIIFIQVTVGSVWRTRSHTDMLNYKLTLYRHYVNVKGEGGSFDTVF